MSEGGGTFRGGGEIVVVDGASSNVRFEPGSSIRRSFPEGANIPVIRFPRNASGGVGSIAYRWTRQPGIAALRAAGMRQFGGADPRIDGTAVKSQGGVDRMLRWVWEAYDQDPGEEPPVQTRDQITVTIIITAPDPIVLVATPTITLAVHQTGFSRRLNDASGGRGTFAYRLEPYLSATPLATLGLAFDGRSNTLSTSPRVANLPGIYVYSHYADDGRNTVGRTARIQIRGALTARPLRFSAAKVEERWVQGRSHAVYLPRAEGGTGPGTYGYQLAGDFPAGAGFEADSTRIATATSAGITRAGVYAGSLIVRDQTHPTPQSASIPVRITVAPAPTFSGPTSFGPYSPDTAVGADLPELLNPGGRVSYSVSAAAARALAAAGLRAAGRRLSGRTPATLTAAQIQGGVPFGFSAQVGARSYDVACRVTLRAADSIAFVSQPQDLIYDEATAIEPVTLPPASGGSGSFSYRLAGAGGSGLALEAGRRLAGTTAAVAADRTWRARLQAADRVTGRTATAYFSITVRDVPDARPPAGTLELEDSQYTFADDSAAAIALPPATGTLAAAAAYSAAAMPGRGHADVTIAGGRTLQITARTRDAARTAAWTRTATSGAATATAWVVAVIFGRLRYAPGVKVLRAARGELLPDGWGDWLQPLGGRRVAGDYRRYAVIAQFPPASGVTLAAGRRGRLTVAGTPALATADAVVRCTDYPKSDGGSSTADLTVRLTTEAPEPPDPPEPPEPPPFIFGDASYSFSGAQGEVVDWEAPRPGGRAVAALQAGSTGAAGFSPEILSGLSQPAATGDGWRIRGSLDATPGIYSYVLRATAADGATADADLFITVSPAATERPATATAFRTPCGVRTVTRRPRTAVLERSLRSTLPDPETGVGAIVQFEVSSLIAMPGEMLNFNWEVLDYYNQVQIPEVDFSYTDPALPLCAGQPNEVHVLSVEPRVAGGHEVQAPTTPGIYSYRLTALRAGWGAPYQAADSWTEWVLVTADAAARHLSFARSPIVAREAVPYRIAYRGEAPAGGQRLTLTPRYDEAAALLPPPQEARPSLAPPAGPGLSGAAAADDEYSRLNPGDPLYGGGD